MKASLQSCAFDKPTWANAGFYIEEGGKEGQGAFMVILMEYLAPEACTS
jgi:hypothetical protein